MNETIIYTIVSAIVTLVGTFGGILTASKLSNYRIEQLEKKVDKHNSIVEKTFGLEKDVQEIQKDIIRIDNSNKKMEENIHGLDTRVTLLEKGRG